VPEPDHPPASEPEVTAKQNTDKCEPHGDHWHCPPGVPEPSNAPSGEPGSTSSVGNPAATTPVAPVSDAVKGSTGGSIAIVLAVAAVVFTV
jgi:hypothetical protein